MVPVVILAILSAAVEQPSKATCAETPDYYKSRLAEEQFVFFIGTNEDEDSAKRDAISAAEEYYKTGERGKEMILPSVANGSLSVEVCQSALNSLIDRETYFNHIAKLYHLDQTEHSRLVHDCSLWVAGAAED